MDKIKIDGMRFVTESGKQVIFNGINMVCKDKAKGYIQPDLERLLSVYLQKGMNLLRFGIFWDGVEPEPGQYDMAYLARVKDCVRLAADYGFYVMLDMHQDLFARKYGDGAPDWATLDAGASHPEDCTMWYDAYLRSDAIIQAADCFWANTRALDGIGLLDHYEKMWERIAEVFSDCDNVIGFEPMNEPFMGSVAREAFGTAMMKTKEQFPDFDMSTPLAVAPEQAAVYIGYVSERLQTFDSTVLMDFYKRIADAVHKYSDKPLITGGNIYCSSTVRTGIKRLADGNQIYAPHGYDSVVNTDHYESFSRENVRKLFMDKRDSQLQLGLPVIVGEWGAFPPEDFTNLLLDHMTGILEEYLWGSTYWEHISGMENDSRYEALSRAYPMETAGVLKNYHFNRENGRFTMAYDGIRGAVTRVYCPFTPSAVQGNKISWRFEAYPAKGGILYVTAEADGEIDVTVIR